MTNYDMSNLDFELAELNRRIANLVKIGVIEEADYSQAIPRAKVRMGDLLTTWLPMLALRAGQDQSWWPLEVGEQVLVLSPSGDPAQGFILGSINQSRVPANGNKQELHRTNYADGAVIEYDRAAHALNAQLPSGATTELISDGGVSVFGDLTVDGNIKATQDITDKKRSMQADRDIYNGHIHPGVTPGSGVTGKTISTK